MFPMLIFDGDNAVNWGKKRPFNNCYYKGHMDKIKGVGGGGGGRWVQLGWGGGMGRKGIQL